MGLDLATLPAVLASITTGYHWFATSRSSVCSFITVTKYHMHQPNFTAEFFHYNFRGKSVNFSLAIIRNNSYLKENMIFWTKVQILSHDPWQIVNGTPSMHKLMFYWVKLATKMCILLLVASMKLTEFLNPPFIRSGIDLKDYFLSFKVIYQTWHISKQLKTYYLSTKRINTNVKWQRCGLKTECVRCSANRFGKIDLKVYINCKSRQTFVLIRRRYIQM